MFGAIFRYFKYACYMVIGKWDAAADALASNKHVMKATYDRSIKKSEERFGTVKDAVAELINIEQTRKMEIKELGNKVDHLTKVKNGAQVAMQKRLNDLKAQGKTKEEILADVEFIKHRAAFEDASSTLGETTKRMDDKENDLKTRQQQIATYKAELQSMQRSAQSLREEQNEAIADVAIAEQQEAINSMIAGIQSDTTDKDLSAARAARQRAKSKATITAELAGNDARLAENEYLDYAAKQAANTELDGLLNWGEETKEEKKGDADLSPAKLPE